MKTKKALVILVAIFTLILLQSSVFANELTLTIGIDKEKIRVEDEIKMFATGELETPTKYNDGELVLKISGNYTIIYVLSILIIFIIIVFMKKFIGRK